MAIQKSIALNKDKLDVAEFLEMDGANLSFDEKSFDKIIGQSVLHHLDFNKAICDISKF